MKRKRKYTRDLLGPIVRRSFSMADVLRALDLKLAGGNYRHIKSLISHFGLSTSHFTGQLWSKGKTAEDDSRVAAQARKISLSDAEVFRENSRPFSGSLLRPRLIKMGWKYECAICGLSDWLGSPITLHVDHKNGKSNDNQLSNLRFLCPNCHQQTPTWGRKPNT